MRICDSHVHFWKQDVLNYNWLNGELDRDFVPGDLVEHAGEFMPEKIVFVEAGCASPTLDEVAWIESLNDPRIAAIVADVPLELDEDEVRPTVEKLAANPLVKGIRRTIQSRDAGFAMQPDFLAGVRMLSEFDLSFDICIKHQQMGDALDLVLNCPKTRFVLDHIGKPGIKDGLLDPWREQITTLAGFPNVQCKLSGMVTEADLANWTPEQLRPYIDHIIGAFGVERVMFGSDWPVQARAATYPQWIEVLQDALKDFSDDEKDAIFYRNGAAFYAIA